MSCRCADLPEIVRLDEHPTIESGSEQLEMANWTRLMCCRVCGQLWAVDEWEKYQRQLAVKIPQREGWGSFDTMPLRREFLVQSRGGLTDEPCIWAGCGQPRVRGVVYCADHLWKTGARE